MFKNNSLLTFLFFSLLYSLPNTMIAKAADYSLVVDVAKKGVDISPELYGLFFSKI